MVATKSGSVRGITQTTAISGIRVQKFLNIPYAEAPVGRLRFKKPQPKKPWNGNMFHQFKFTKQNYNICNTLYSVCSALS